jgi:putative transposase
VHAFKATRRNLPHWQEPGRVYFITWRGQKGQNLDLEERTITLEAIKYWDTIKWTVYAAVARSRLSLVEIFDTGYINIWYE